ncbi:hypothetical protein LOD99_14683 [Oopsacas minuta]|uniref:DM10 domain-containing protein n=1 Tax=Oopsacas minuta TaxID=111878 RepID=A0AAV7KCV7_9METZ|nr:hypothetical protein LOD99_14683 [Oopsacas minuta]
MPTRCIGNLNLKENYQNTILHKANSPPAICHPDIWGPVDMEYRRINHAFIINDDLYKVFERHCMFKLDCPVLEKVGEFIIQDHAKNDNSKFKLFNDCGRRVIENVLKAVGPSQLNDLYKRYNIIDMGIIIADFDIRYYSSTYNGETPNLSNELPSNASGPLGFVIDPYAPGHTINIMSPPSSLFHPGPQFNLTTNQTIRQQQFDSTEPPPKVTRSSSGTSTRPDSQPSSLPSSGVQAYLKFDTNNPIWNIQSLEQMAK